VVNVGGGNKVWLNDGTGAFSDSGQNLGSRDSRGVALADLDGPTLAAAVQVGDTRLLDNVLLGRRG